MFFNLLGAEVCHCGQASTASPTCFVEKAISFDEWAKAFRIDGIKVRSFRILDEDAKCEYHSHLRRKACKAKGALGHLIVFTDKGIKEPV
jgi:hypothetical protein